MIRPMIIQDCSLSFRMTFPDVFLSFWTSFWARKNPYYEYEDRSSEPIDALHLWFVLCSQEIFHYRSEWHFPMFFLSFWTSFWVRKNPYYECEDRSGKSVGVFHLWFVQWLCRIVHYRSVWHFLMFFCHSERAFGRGRIPTMSARIEVVNLLTTLQNDNPRCYMRDGNWLWNLREIKNPYSQRITKFFTILIYFFYRFFSF